ncbi:MAG: DUF4085 family protein [Cytobacillus gottheilii]|uniref:DUF4085 family protein n=1 Tax=Cytobacillus gottheilii TaxID=859144 RepID=UPI000832F12F|nr:DUF4085 family protein [Cytobacillus gottheilii]
MWHLTREAQVRFAQVNLLPIHESDEDWEIALSEAEEEGEDLFASLKEDLDEVREELQQVLPSRFITYLDNNTLNHPSLPKAVREDYLQWMREGDQEFEQILEAAGKSTEHAIPFLLAAAQEVFNESFHDGRIERIIRESDTLHIYINTEGGFSTKAYVHLMLKGVTSEETDLPLEAGQYFIYDELQKIEDGFAFRVLFDCPSSQWTITMKDVDARSFYRPKQYSLLYDEDRFESTSLEEYVSELNPDHRYWLFTPDAEIEIKMNSNQLLIDNGSLEMTDDEILITTSKGQYTYDIEEYSPLQFIYTDTYENPYEQQNEPVPADELEDAALSDDLELQVRAWNTMYRGPQELADIINTVLSKIEINEENEMILTVYVNHFYQEEILKGDVIEKFKELIE